MKDLFSNWTGRVDAEEGVGARRWHEIVQRVEDDVVSPNAAYAKIAFLGFCSDEGVRRNKGRAGAAMAPQAIRRACANLPDHFPKGTRLFEAGDIHPEGEPLEKAQEKLSNRVAKLFDDGYFPLVLGGGHEVAWGTFSGLRRALSDNQRLGIINIDAHFDIRQPVEGATSGTGFYQMAESSRQANRSFHYCCLGIQPYANTRTLFERADEWKVRYHTAAELTVADLYAVYQSLDEFMEGCDSLYLSLDMDAFDAAYAPGVSAPNAMGLVPHHCLPALRRIMRSGKVAAMDIAEVNPSFDIDGRTSKLAAVLIFELLGARFGSAVPH